MPDVPASVPSAEEKLDLPDVPTKPPVAAEAAADDEEVAPAEASSKRKGLTHTHTHTRPLNRFACTQIHDLRPN